MSSKEEAREAVERIARRYGYYTPETLDRAGARDPETRQVLEAQSVVSKAFKTKEIEPLAKKVFSSNALFVYELLQNADKCNFTTARRNGQTPHMLFQVHPDRIVIEYNEDGFIHEDVEELCAFNQSTRPASYGYRGTQGVGFKSTFLVANKVHIQSQQFSFHFSHEKGDSGLGMILPYWEETDKSSDKSSPPFTRITLYLRPGDPSERENLTNNIADQFEGLTTYCLLFLKNIRLINVKFYNKHGDIKNSKTLSAIECGLHKFRVKTTITSRGEKKSQESLCHVTKHTHLSNEEQEGNPSTSEVVLVFMVNHNQVALEPAKERIFAFLPIGSPKYGFAIHADFDTNADGKEIITTSKKNESLLDGIATAFIMGVLQFCEDPVLCYQWPRFLPKLNNECSSFWSILNQKIKQQITNTAVVRSRHGTTLHLLNELTYLGNWLLEDERGDCLYDDSTSDQFISKNYTTHDAKLLASYGLCKEMINSHLAALEADLNSPQSRMKDFSRTETWQSNASTLLLKCLEDYPDIPWVSSRVKSLAIIPLQGGEWVSSSSGVVYLPTTKGVPIPPGLNMRVVDPRALVNPDRKELLEALGLKEPPISLVRDSIAVIYRSNTKISLALSVSHLRYLYLTHNHDGASTRIQNLFLWMKDGERINPEKADMYIEGDKLCDAGIPQSTLGKLVSYLHPTYLENPPQREAPLHPSWQTWLYDFIGIRRRLKLFSPDNTTFSPTVQNLASFHPREYLRALEFLWKHENESNRQDDRVRQQIMAVPAAKFCLHAERIKARTLGQTWLPVPQLKVLVDVYSEKPLPFPFLWINEYGSSDSNKKWSFLNEDFGVGKDADVRFYVELLQHILVANLFFISAEQTKKIVRLYLTIEDAAQRAESNGKGPGYILKDINENCILVPACGKSPAIWAKLDSCRWRGPPGMMTKHCLQQRYAAILGAGQMQKLESFFSRRLCIPDTTCSEVLQDLETLSQGNSKNLEQVRGFYKYLTRLNTSTVRAQFNQESLVLARQDGRLGWFKASECVWSFTGEIPGTPTLVDYSDDLREFFTGILGVKLRFQSSFSSPLRDDPQQKPVAKATDDSPTLNLCLLRFKCKRVGPSRLFERSIVPSRPIHEKKAALV